MNAHDAAEAIRPTFHLESMPPEDRHHVLFVEAVADELGIEKTAFNMHQVASALDAADIHQDSNEFPMMLYSRQHHADGDVAPSVYDQRGDYVWVHVANEDEAKSLGSGWVQSIDDLPPRGETPIDAPLPAAPVPVVQSEVASHVEDEDNHDAA